MNLFIFIFTSYKFRYFIALCRSLSLSMWLMCVFLSFDAFWRFSYCLPCRHIWIFVSFARYYLFTISFGKAFFMRLKQNRIEPNFTKRNQNNNRNNNYNYNNYNNNNNNDKNCNDTLYYFFFLVRNFCSCAVCTRQPKYFTL